jgi:hypothetical protein
MFYFHNIRYFDEHEEGAIQDVGGTEQIPASALQQAGHKQPFKG